MKRIALSLGVLLGYVLAGMPAFGEESSCIYCGMYRSRYEHSWTVIEYEGIPPEGYCSIHCAAISMALHTDRTIERIIVGDFDSHQQVDANKANWVIGGSLPGVMTRRAKWAFATPEAAADFITKYGGQQATLHDVLKATFDDMLSDTLMIRKKRQLIDKQANHAGGERE